MLKIGSEKDFDIVDGHGHPYVVVVYEEHSLSHIVGPWPSFAKATHWCDTYPWREDAYGIVEILYPPDVVWP